MDVYKKNFAKRVLLIKCIFITVFSDFGETVSCLKKILPNKRADNLQLLIEHLWNEIVCSFRERRRKTDSAES